MFPFNLFRRGPSTQDLANSLVMLNDAMYASPEATIVFKKMSGTAVAPTYATDGAAGMDLYADQDCVVPPAQRRLVVTNIAIELPDGIEAQVRSRSGLAAKHGVSVLNSPGTIDPDYRGSIGVVLHNSGDLPFFIKPGDRIAQLVFAPFYRVELVEVDLLGSTVRNDAGFGSTGVGAR